MSRSKSVSPTRIQLGYLLIRSKSTVAFNRLFSTPEEDSLLLNLDYETLGTIVSYLDYNSYYSVLCTCRKLNFVASVIDNWSRSVLQRRALYFIHVCLTGTVFTEDETWTRKFLTDLLLIESTYLCNTLQAVNFEKMEVVWRKFGPVAGKLYSLLCKFNTNEETYRGSLVGGLTCIVKTKTFNFALSKGDLDMVIATFHDTNTTSKYVNYLKIAATFSDNKITFVSDRNGLGLTIGHTSEISYKLQSLKPIINIIQDELGNTTPPIRPDFLKWFLENVPDNYSPAPFYDDYKPLFEEQSYNHLPSSVSIRPCLMISNEYLVSEFKKKFKKLGCLFPQKAHNADELGKCVSLIMTKYGMAGLKQLQQAYQCIRKVQTRYCLHLVAQEVLSKMVLHIDFLSLAGYWGPEAISNGHILTKINFRLANRRILTIVGKADTEIREYLAHPIYSNQSLSFFLPDEREIIVKPVYCEGKLQADFNVLDPVTLLLQDCIDNSCFLNEPLIIPNAIVFDFFICILKGMKLVFKDYEPMLRVELDKWYEICEQSQVININDQSGIHRLSPWRQFADKLHLWSV